MANKWIAFFSQTGAEIADLSENLGRWPDKIVTNKRSKDLRTIDSRIVEKGFIELPNKPTPKNYKSVIENKSIVTLHGWLRIMPPSICKNYTIINGHPGLITKYPELKGKDPQMRAYQGKYKTIGSVLHKVVKGVDEGEVISEAQYSNDLKLDIGEIFLILRNISLSLWTDYLKKVL